MTIGNHLLKNEQNQSNTSRVPNFLGKVIRDSTKTRSPAGNEKP